MSQIEIPYLPIRGFEESDICKKFAEASLEKAEDLNVRVDKSLLFPEEKNLSIDVVLLLHGMGMEKYIELFQKEEIPLETFLLLNDSDLQELGITNPEDRENIIKNLEIHQLKKKEFVIPENHADDLKIAKNVFNQLLLLQNYCAYIELKMKKHKLKDYNIGWKDSACVYLKAFTEAAIIQSQRLSSSLFVESHCDHLIGKLLLQMYNLTLPKHLQEKLRSNKRSYSSNIFKAMVVVGFCSIILLTGKCIFGRKESLLHLPFMTDENLNK